MAANPPIGFRLARRSTDAGASFAAFTSATKCWTASRVAGLRLKSNVTPASSWTSLSARASVPAWRQAVTIRVERAGEYQREAGRAIFKIVKRLRVGCRRVGMIDALDNLPRLRRPSGDRLGARRARIKRLDAQAVISPADQPLVEISALERGIDQLAPFRVGCRREFARQGESGARQSCRQNGTGPAQGPLR